MPDDQNPICIGGPLAGQRVAAEGSASFTYAVDGGQFPYRMQFLRRANDSIAIWVPSGQTIDETLALLLAAYEEANR